MDPEELLDRAYALTGEETRTKDLYRDWAMTYDATMMDGLGYLSPSLVADATAMQCNIQARILDVGCGTGLLGQELTKRGFHDIDGLDYSPEMLEVARSKGCFSKLMQVDLNAYPYEMPIATYEVIVSCGTFTHGHVEADCLPALVKLLKPGGHFLATVHRDLWEPAGFTSCLDELMADKLIFNLFTTSIKLFASDEDEPGILVGFVSS